MQRQQLSKKLSNKCLFNTSTLPGARGNVGNSACHEYNLRQNWIFALDLSNYLALCCFLKYSSCHLAENSELGDGVPSPSWGWVSSGTFQFLADLCELVCIALPPWTCPHHSISLCYGFLMNLMKKFFLNPTEHQNNLLSKIFFSLQRTIANWKNFQVSLWWLLLIIEEYELSIDVQQYSHKTSSWKPCDFITFTLSVSVCQGLCPAWLSPLHQGLTRQQSGCWMGNGLIWGWTRGRYISKFMWLAEFNFF